MVDPVINVYPPAGSPAWLSALLGGAGALIGAVSAAGISRSWQRTSARETTIEANRLAHREIVVAILHNGREWAYTWERLIPARGLMTVDDTMQFGETESGKRVAALRTTLSQDLTTARLLIEDSSVSDPIEKLADAINNFTEVVMGKFYVPGRTRRPTHDEAMPGIEFGLAYVAKVNAELTKLETASLALYRTVVVDGKGSRRARLWAVLSQPVQRVKNRKPTT